MNKKCLVIVDVQKCFCPGGNLPVNHHSYEVWKMVDKINKLIQSKKENKDTGRNDWLFDHIVYTQDAHPKNHSSFTNNHLGKKTIDGKPIVPWKFDPCQKIKINNKTQFLWPDHAVNDGSDNFGIDFHSYLDTTPLQRPIIFDESVYLNTPIRDGRGRVIWKGQDKNVDQFSGFLPTKKGFASRVHKGINTSDKGINVSILEKFLKDKDVKEVYFCGLVREVCVWRTAIKGLNGIDKYFMWDCTLPINISLDCVRSNPEYRKQESLDKEEIELHNYELEKMLKHNYLEVIYNDLMKEGNKDNLWYQVYLKPYNVNICNFKDLNF